jgi:hypothetical protein
MSLIKQKIDFQQRGAYDELYTPNEAIEMLCFPVADSLDPRGNFIKYYDFIYDDITPIKTVDNWFLLKNLIPQILDNYPNNMHKVVCWWIKYKRDLGIKIMRQVNA